MSAVEPSTQPTLTDYPDFDLHYRFDDPADPSEVTIYPVTDFDDITTTWLTIDADHAVALEDLR